MAEQPDVIVPTLQCWRPYQHGPHVEDHDTELHPDVPRSTRCRGVLAASPGRVGNWRCPTCNTAPLAKRDDGRLQCPTCGQLCTRHDPGTPDAPRPDYRGI